MRQHAKALLQAHEFNEAQLLAKQIAEQEQEETRIATEKMKDGYKMATLRMRAKYQVEMETLSKQYDSKISAVNAAETVDLLPATRKLNYLKKQKESASLILKKNRASNSKKVIVTPETNVFSVTAPIQVNTKLKLPALPSIQDTLKGYNSDL